MNKTASFPYTEELLVVMMQKILAASVIFITWNKRHYIWWSVYKSRFPYFNPNYFIINKRRHDLYSVLQQTN